MTDMLPATNNSGGTCSEATHPVADAPREALPRGITYSLGAYATINHLHFEEATNGEAFAHRAREYGCEIFWNARRAHSAWASSTRRTAR